MDAKLTLSFDEAVVTKAKRYAEKNNISLSRLVEFLLQKVTAENPASLEDFPISDWVHMVSEGEVQYQTQKRGRKATRKAYYAAKK